MEQVFAEWGVSAYHGPDEADRPWARLSGAAAWDLALAIASFATSELCQCDVRVSSLPAATLWMKTHRYHWSEDPQLLAVVNRRCQDSIAPSASNACPGDCGEVTAP